MITEKGLTYEERVDWKSWVFTTLGTRRLRGDLIEVFKIFKGFDDIKHGIELTFFQRSGIYVSSLSFFLCNVFALSWVELVFLYKSAFRYVVAVDLLYFRYVNVDFLYVFATVVIYAAITAHVIFCETCVSNLCKFVCFLHCCPSKYRIDKERQRKTSFFQERRQKTSQKKRPIYIQ